MSFRTIDDDSEMANLFLLCYVRKTFSSSSQLNTVDAQCSFCHKDCA